MAEGDKARVFNDRGELIGTVKILARSISMRGNGRSLAVLSMY
ncbi:hypothetical protein B4110_3528 [Parageobacillus toebii]|uniref:Uncharacterized protein n=1 Tax=Parageobacillus toebii TaxID=153151 RepID=A0A150M9R7_9BACL|nr:hypothetical protein B4110_3528 [Parageobacillus toebii]